MIIPNKTAESACYSISKVKKTFSTHPLEIMITQEEELIDCLQLLY